MGKDARLELRVEPELKRRVDTRARELGQKTTTFVERALEEALGGVAASGVDSGGVPVAGSVPARPASPRASDPPGPPTEMLDREHLMKTGRPRMLPLDPNASSVDEAMEAAREGARARDAALARQAALNRAKDAR